MKHNGLKTKIFAAVLLFTMGFMAACDSDSDKNSDNNINNSDNNNNNNNNDETNSNNVQFVDSPVIGISYTTSSGKSGVTNAEGKFTYENGDAVTFFVGGFELPSGIPQDTSHGNVITPAHLAGADDWENNTMAVNIIQFLLSIDEDQNPENGIQIPAGLADFADEWLDGDSIDFNDSEFDNDFEDFLAAASTEFETTFTLVDETTAKEHFNATIDDLDLDIEVSTEAVPCTGHTSPILGLWVAELTGDISDEIGIEVNGISLRIDGGPAIDACTYSQTQVTLEELTIITSTWVWVKNAGEQVITITLTDDVRTIVVIEGEYTGIGTLIATR